MQRLLGRAAAATAALTLLAPATAYADEWGSSDAGGDVEGFNYNPEPQPCGTETELDTSAEGNEDITRLQVRHTRRDVVVTLRFADLVEDREQVLEVNLRASTGGYDLDLDRPAPSSGEWRVFADLSTEPVYPDPDDVPDCGSFGVISEGIRCRVAHDIRFGKDVIRLTVPRTCLGNPRWVRAAASSYCYADAGGGSFDLYFDDWDHGGHTLNYWLPPFGPRVHATDGATIGGGTPHPRTSAQRHVLYRHDVRLAQGERRTSRASRSYQLAP